MVGEMVTPGAEYGLNESPSEKEGKYPVAPITVVPFHQPQ